MSFLSSYCKELTFVTYPLLNRMTLSVPMATALPPTTDNVLHAPDEKLNYFFHTSCSMFFYTIMFLLDHW